MKCDVCGHQLEIGQWPFCKGSKEDHLGPMGGFEDPMEPYDDWNITSEADSVLITTRSQRRKLMDKQGLDYRKKGHRLGQTMYFFQKG